MRLRHFITVIVTAAACARPTTTTRGPQDRAARNAAAVLAAREKLSRILRTGEWPALSSFFTPRAVVQTASETFRGGDSTDAIHRLVQASLDVTLMESRSEFCAEGAREIGTMRVSAPGQGSASEVTLPYVVHWVVPDSGDALIDRLILFDRSPRSLITDVPCRALRGVARARGVVVFAAPGSAVTLTDADDQLVHAAAQAGWVESSVQTGGRGTPAASPITLTIGVRVPLHSLWLESGLATGSSVSTGVYNIQYKSSVNTQVNTSEGHVLLLAQRGIVRFGGGPALISSRWTGSEGLQDRAVPQSFPPIVKRSRTTLSVGAVAQLSLSFDVGIGQGNALDAFAKYRVSPAVQSGSLGLFPGFSVTQNAMILGVAIAHAF